MEDDWTLECPEICTHMKWYLPCDVGNGITDAIWKLMMEDLLKMGLKMPSKECGFLEIFLWRESLLLLLRRNLMRNAGICLGRYRSLGASAIRYSTGEITSAWGSESELHIWSGYWMHCDLLGKCEIDRVWSGPCLAVLWTIVWRWERRNLDGKVMRRNLDSRVTSKWKPG